MKLSTLIISAALLASSAVAHDDDELQMPMGYVKYPYQAAYGKDIGTYRIFTAHKDHLIQSFLVTADSVFSGITTFAKLPWVQCFGAQKDTQFDIAFLGAPFDTGTSYRPGARFGPSGIRAGSRRLVLYGGYNVPLNVNPFVNLTIVDCGDIPVTPYDNAFAIKQIEDGHKELIHRTPATKLGVDKFSGEQLVSIANDGKEHPRIITLGGDHTIVLPVLRSIHSAYGSISVIHFDSHLDTWKPAVFGGAPSHQAEINHGTYFYWASQEGLIKNGSSIASIFSFSQSPHSGIFYNVVKDTLILVYYSSSMAQFERRFLVSLTMKMTMHLASNALKHVKLILSVCRLFFGR